MHRFWTTAAAGLAGLVAGLGLGLAVPHLRRDPAPAPSQQRWRTLDGERADDVADALVALGYAAGVAPPRPDVGVTVHDPDRAWPGANLIVSGHAPEALLMGMDGQVLHRWSRPWEELFPSRPDGPATRGYWRRARLLPGDDLIVLATGYGVARLDRDSQVRWVWAGAAHHDVRVHGDQVWTLVRERREHEGQPIDDDQITVLDLETGAERFRVSLLDALTRSPWAPLLDQGRHPPDVFHANTVVPLTGPNPHPAFRAGRVLVSSRHLDALLVVDMDQEEVVWAATGLWTGPHEPQVLPDGGLLVFDNQGDWPRSRVLELDPSSLAVRWAWGEEGIATETCGTAQRLPGGTTLVVASNQGRAVEVTPDGEVVWEYHSPARTTDDAGRTLVGNLFQVERVTSPSDGAAAAPAARAGAAGAPPASGPDHSHSSPRP